MKLKLRHLFLAVTLASAGHVYGADSSTSPYDTNPACMDIHTDSSTGNCIIQNEGTPRHRYPPPGPSSMPGNNLGKGSTTGSGSSPGTAAAPASPTMRLSAPSSGSK